MITRFCENVKTKSKALKIYCEIDPKNILRVIAVIFAFLLIFLTGCNSSVSYSELGKISETTYERGHDEGYNEGHQEGYDEGYEEGYDEGHEEGCEYGYERGYDDGYEDGYENKYEYRYEYRYEL